MVRMSPTLTVSCCFFLPGVPPPPSFLSFGGDAIAPTTTPDPATFVNVRPPNETATAAFTEITFAFGNPGPAPPLLSWLVAVEAFSSVFAMSSDADDARTFERVEIAARGK